MGAGSWIHEAGGPACRVVTVSTRSISLALEASIKEEGKKYVEIFRSLLSAESDSLFACYKKIIGCNRIRCTV